MKDNATFDLPGFSPAEAPPSDSSAGQPELKRSRPRPRRTLPKQEQLELLEPTDTSGLPVWHRDDNLDLTGLPIWAPA